MKRNSIPTTALAIIWLSGASGAFASILNTAGDFTVLGGTAITSSGTAGTIISNGNVGVSPAATTSITGFPPAVIENGAIIATGAVTAQAREDLIRAQTGINAMPSDANISNVDLGGQTLVPGTYTFNEGANQTGELVLDGQGENNVFWVFQIGTSLTTAINSTITIINPGSKGGSDYGIFWNCGTAINIGANNQIAGIYLAGTSIVFGQNSTRGGRALALAAVTLDNNQIDARGGAGGTDYSGGLTFDANGNVVPIVEPGTVIPDPVIDTSPLTFRFFGKRKRDTHKGSRVIRGDASTSAVTVQWRTPGRKAKWRTVEVAKSGRWVLKVRRLKIGRNKVILRAQAFGGAASSRKRLIIQRR